MSLNIMQDKGWRHKEHGVGGNAELHLSRNCSHRTRKSDLLGKRGKPSHFAL